MDVRWVSSLSWYFLNYFGLNGVYRLLLGNDNCELFVCFSLRRPFQPLMAAADSSVELASPFAAGTQQPMQTQDYGKLFRAEKDNLELAEGLYTWAAKDVEVRVLRKYGKLR